MTPVGKGLGRLEGVVESGSSWKALCPAHDAREPSLSVSEADDGPALTKCFAGCEAIEIVAELGLEMGELFERRNGHRKNSHSTPRKRHRWRQGHSPLLLHREKAVSSHTRKGGAGWVLSIDLEEKAVVVQKRRRTTK
jgi:hypothetical protein